MITKTKKKFFKVGIDATVLKFNKEGIGNYLYELIKGIKMNLDRNGYIEFLRKDNKNTEIKFILFCFKNTDFDLEKILKNKYFDQIIIAEQKGKFSGIRNARKLANVAKSKKMDLMISTHSHLLPIFFYPSYYLIHDIGPILFPKFFKNKNNNFKQMIFNFFFRAGIQASEKCLTTTQTIKEEIKNHFKIKKNKIQVIGGGVSNFVNLEIKKNKQDQVLKKYNLISNKYFFCLGTLSPRKSIDTLIKAYAKLLQEKKDYKLVISGKYGWDYKYIFELVDNLNQKYPNINIKSKIIFTNYIENYEVFSLMVNSIALINTSIYEGFGMPPMEAVFLGKEIIVSDISTFRELYHQVAHFFEKKNTDKLLQVMKEVISGKKKNNITLVKSLKNKYNWHAVGDNLIKLILKNS